MKKQKQVKVINPKVLNPIDYFNKECVQYTLNLMVQKPSIEMTSVNSFTFIKNKDDRKKKMIVVEDGFFIAKMNNHLGMEVDEKYTPFRMLVEFVYKKDWRRAISHILYDVMNNEVPYIRVATKYYKRTTKVDRNGIRRNELKLWDKVTIVDDYGKDYLDKIANYDDFTIEPNNKDYKEIINNNYNLYNPFEHLPSPIEGDTKNWVWTKKLLEHMFGEQYELGLQYVKVLYDLPKQKLPILVLISEERSTGKTTFLDWIEMLFGANTVIINPQDISNSFNGAYADKNIIMIEESRFESVQATEKLKNLATQKKILVNSKFVQQYSIPFHGKLIITSNDENKFSRVDNSEIRYWVRKIPSLEGKANHNILNDLRSEIPSFLAFLNTLPDVDTSQSRMVFKAEDLRTKALQIVKKESLPALQKELEILLDEHAIENRKVEQFYFTAKTIKNKWFKNNHRIEINYIYKIIKEGLKLDKADMMRFWPLEQNENNYFPKISGRPFIFKNEYYGTDEP